MKKILSAFAILFALMLMVVTLAACLGGDNLPNNPKGQVLNQPTTAPPSEGASATPPPAGGEQPAVPNDDGDDDEDVAGGDD